MDRSFQTGLASWLAGLGAAGNLLWMGLAAAMFALLSVLSLLAFHTPARMSGFARSRWGAGLLSEPTFLVLTTLTLFLLRLPSVSQLELNYDESGAILGARTLLHDPRFWLSFENTTLGPLHTYSVSLIGMLGFDVNYATTKVFAIVVCWLTLACLYAALRRRYGRDHARLLVLPVAFTFSAFSFFDYVAYNGEHMPMLLLALSYWLLTEIDATKTRAYGACLALGVTLGCIPYGKVQAAPIAVLFGVVACTQSLLRRDRRFPLYIAGALLPTLLLVVNLSVTGALHDFWESYILNNVLYASQGHLGHQRDQSLLRNALHYHSYLRQPLDTRSFFSFTLLLAAGAFVSVARKDGLKALLRHTDLWLGCLAFAAASLAVLLPKNNWTHYLVLLIVPTTILGAGAAHAWWQSLQVAAPRPFGPTGWAWCFVSIFAFLPALNALREGNWAIQHAAENAVLGRTKDAQVRLLERHLQPGDAVALWGGNMRVLVELGARLGTRDAHIERQVDPSKQQSYYVQRWLHDVETRRPEAVLDSTPGDEPFAAYGLGTVPASASVLNAYRLVDSDSMLRLYLRK